MYACTLHAPFHGVVRYGVRMDLLSFRYADVHAALDADPALARALRPRALAPGRWAIVIEDASRARLRELLAKRGWTEEELGSIPLFAVRGRGEIPIAPPQV